MLFRPQPPVAAENAEIKFHQETRFGSDVWICRKFVTVFSLAVGLLSLEASQFRQRYCQKKVGPREYAFGGSQRNRVQV